MRRVGSAVSLTERAEIRREQYVEPTTDVNADYLPRRVGCDPFSRRPIAACSYPPPLSYYEFRNLAQWRTGVGIDVRIWPAIDLRGGKCVRLKQGDYARETVYGEDPAAMARHWVDLGAECLHLVDLDGARDGESVNLPSVRAIVAEAGIPCELGGGIRSEDLIRELLQAGLQRLVIGTLAIKEPDWFRRMCQKFPGRLVLGIDARNGLVATDGWLQTSQLAAVDLAGQFADQPIAAIVYTDISTDGMLAGPNTAAMRAMREAVAVPVVASGGVTTVEDVSRLAAARMAGCIIGRALYERKLTLPEAIEAAQEQ